MTTDVMMLQAFTLPGSRVGAGRDLARVVRPPDDACWTGKCPEVIVPSRRPYKSLMESNPDPVSGWKRVTKAIQDT
jgi:hypothetical protein